MKKFFRSNSKHDDDAACSCTCHSIRHVDDYMVNPFVNTLIHSISVAPSIHGASSHGSHTCHAQGDEADKDEDTHQYSKLC